ncbi:uncharacterized protein LOC130744400 [Lotus japonicus]|uniref:uncharacterized protein LOC130744400 n=1 Tax=Lotus japonicus TaxID=34305 RepID=UPI00258B2C23|nr:uncharacterized protein LOC130744400 [Lotus japonicus]
MSIKIWYECFMWLGISIAQLPSPREHLLQFASSGLSKTQKSGEIAIWMATIWVIWTLRNRTVFNNINIADLDMAHIIELIQVKSWQWIPAQIWSRLVLTYWDMFGNYLGRFIKYGYIPA